jgi:hypothetical protein
LHHLSCARLTPAIVLLDHTQGLGRSWTAYGRLEFVKPPPGFGGHAYLFRPGWDMHFLEVVVLGSALFPHDGHAFQPRDEPPSRSPAPHISSSPTPFLTSHAFCLGHKAKKTCVCVALVSATVCVSSGHALNVHSFSPSQPLTTPAQTTPTKMRSTLLTSAATR